MVVFVQKWLYLEKVVVFGKNVCIRAKGVIIGQSGCIRAKWLYSGKSGCNLESCSIWSKVVVFGQKWLYL